MNYVIGSGPTAVAAAYALLKQGQAVSMLDAGLQLEPERQKDVQALAGASPENWDPAVVSRLKGKFEKGPGGVPEKKLFGSNYPYMAADEELRLKREGIGLQASLAQGGLSTVWGSAMLPSRDADLEDWPINSEQLGPHYEAVLALSGLSGAQDDLEELFPLYSTTTGQLNLSRQAARMLGNLERHRDLLMSEGVRFGRSRVAIQAKAGEREGCVYCGLCMYGCPYGHIYNSSSSLKFLGTLGPFSYQKDVIVTAVHESSQGVTIQAIDRRDHSRLELEGARVFLATGVIPTTQILLRSMEAYEQSARILDSQYFLLPVALRRGISKVREEELHALSQLFIEVLDPNISPYGVHLQVYSYNDLIGHSLRDMLKPLSPALEPLTREMEGRLMLIQGFIHSHHSSSIRSTLKSNGDFLLEPEINPAARDTVNKVVRKIVKLSGKLGIWPALPMLKVAEPGRSFHAGGSFPMRTNPSGFESDLLGRPAGWNRVHAVDASVFPSVPATTITFTAMANAHRIATEVAQLES